jgi:hypothetical protein
MGDTKPTYGTYANDAQRDEQGRLQVRDVHGNLVPLGSGKCPACGRDQINTGDGYESDGQPLRKTAVPVKPYAKVGPEAPIGIPAKPPVAPVAVKPAPKFFGAK